MSRICGRQFAGRNFQNSEPDGHEHIRRVVVAEHFICFYQDIAHTVFNLRIIHDNSFGEHHEQSTGYPLSAYVCNDQTKMIFVDKVEIVKISAYILCRIHGREQVDLFPFRERRENVRKHARLNLSGCT